MICGLNVLHPITQEKCTMRDRVNRRRLRMWEVKSDRMWAMFLFSALLSVSADQVLPTKGKLYQLETSLQKRHRLTRWVFVLSVLGINAA